MRSIIALIAFPLMAALAGCSGHPWQPSPEAMSCRHAPATSHEYFARRMGLRVGYVEAACSLGWTYAQVWLRANRRDDIAGDCRTATGRRLLYAPCGDLENEE